MTDGLSGNFEEYVTLLYSVLLDRAPDPAGLAAAVSALQERRMTPPQFAKLLATSPELLKKNAKYRARAVKTLADTASPNEHGEGPLVTEDYLGCKFIVPTRSVFRNELLSVHGYEPWVLPYFLELCQPGMNVLDVGASWGAFALPAAKRIGPSGRVVAIEVSSSNCRAMIRNLRASEIDNVDILALGLSDKLGVDLLPRKESGNNNVLNGDAEVGSASLDLYDVVPVIALDMLFKNLPKIDVMKIDIEGMEYKALLGAKDFIAANKPIIFCEYSPDFQRRGSGVEGSALLTMLVDAGYKIEILHRRGARELVAQADVASNVARVDSAWRDHVAEGGTHLDLCFLPPA